MGLFDFFRTRKTKLTRRRLRGIEPLEERANLSLPAEIPLVDFSGTEVAQNAIPSDSVGEINDLVGDSSQSFEAASKMVDKYLTLLHSHQQDIPALATIEPLEPTELVVRGQAELDLAIDALADKEFARLETDELVAERIAVRELEWTLNEIASTVGDLHEAEAIRDMLLLKAG